jgi:hypothetical protein
MPSPSDAGGAPAEGQSPRSDPAAGHEPRSDSAAGHEPRRDPAAGHEPRSDPAAGHEPRRDPEPGSPEETLRRLEQRLNRASEAAERLMAQVAAEAARGVAAASAVAPASAGEGTRAGAGTGAEADESAAGDANPDGSGQTPPAGWQTPEDDPPRVPPELDPFVGLVQAMRELIPPELQQRLIAALREVLLALRALIDWYLERIDRRRGQGVEVQDIPIL